MTRSKHQWKGNLRLNWTDIETCVKILSNKIRDTGFEFEKIATVSRGGLIPARLIADQFDVKTILVDRHKIPAKTLFVDDIYDSGKTFRKIISQVKSPESFVYATLMARNRTKYPKHLVYAKKTKGMEYVVFPWDMIEHDLKNN
ncbi:MAG: phosphoribosyltransferase [Thaumarchaeota archaeon]|nr:phosphoribosyltransferase [Nitrososphaerota archaeon]